VVEVGKKEESYENARIREKDSNFEGLNRYVYTTKNDNAAPFRPPEGETQGLPPLHPVTRREPAPAFPLGYLIVWEI